MSQKKIEVECEYCKSSENTELVELVEKGRIYRLEVMCENCRSHIQIETEKTVKHQLM